MYIVSKRMEIAGAHQLNLPYESKCSNLHGHNWIVTVYCATDELTDCGMVIDFKKLKDLVHDRLDHTYINYELENINPTAENIAKWIHDVVDAECETGYCCKVDVQESEGNTAMYIDPRWASLDEMV